MRVGKKNKLVEKAPRLANASRVAILSTFLVSKLLPDQGGRNGGTRKKTPLRSSYRGPFICCCCLNPLFRRTRKQLGGNYVVPNRIFDQIGIALGGKHFHDVVLVKGYCTGGHV